MKKPCFVTLKHADGNRGDLLLNLAFACQITVSPRPAIAGTPEASAGWHISMVSVVWDGGDSHEHLVRTSPEETMRGIAAALHQ